MTYRFHLLGIPHTISTPEYSACAFTQKVVKLCKMLTASGHHVIHYGHEHSKISCAEHVTVTTQDDLDKSYADHDWRRQGFPNYSFDDPIYHAFFTNTIGALSARKQRGDFLLCSFGANHKPVADAHPDMIICEPGIGYPGGGFAKFRVFESYAIMHIYLGMASVGDMNNDMWYDVVIPNYFDIDDFKFSHAKDDYFLFLGRVGPGKGVHIAQQIVEAVGGRLIVAGPGALLAGQTRTNRPISDFVEHVGVVGPEQRKHLMMNAKATLAPSMFLEPFCGVQIESMLSGTPVISTDWGAFAEYNLHGVTGYRCRTFEQFTWAARNIDTIDPAACRSWARTNFSLERVAAMYDEYFFSVQNIFRGSGWYQSNPHRANLDWLTRYGPDASQKRIGPSLDKAIARDETHDAGRSVSEGLFQTNEGGKDSDGLVGDDNLAEVRLKAIGHRGEPPMPYVIDDLRPDLGGNMRYGDLHTWCPVLWRFLVERFGVQSVLDVGCGEGHAVLFFHRLGVRAQGIDGLITNVRRAVTPIALHDLLSGPYVMPVDLVWSCEVAEHIAPDKVHHYIDTLTNGRIIAMTHAVPGQGGHNHVNCQPDGYWNELLAARGYSLAPENPSIRQIASKDIVWNHFAASGLVFFRS